MNQAKRDAQALSFAYGNVAIDDPTVTKERILEAFRNLYGREPLMLPPGWSAANDPLAQPSKPA